MRGSSPARLLERIAHPGDPAGEVASSADEPLLVCPVVRSADMSGAARGAAGDRM